MADELFDRGVAIREQMFGPERAQAKIDRATDFTREFEELVTRYCGIPAAVDGFRNASAVLDEVGVA